MYTNLKILAGIAKCKFQQFLTKENGEVNIVAMVILIAIAVVLGIAFKDKITSILTSLFATITEKTESVGGEVTF